MCVDGLKPLKSKTVKEPTQNDIRWRYLSPEIKLNTSENTDGNNNFKAKLLLC